jgi:hypothetical protein
MRCLFFLCSIFFAVVASGQDLLELPKSGKHLWSKSEWRSANTARFSFYMSKQTRESIRFMNLSRMYGDKFAQIYLDSIPNKDGYIKSLITTLNKRKPTLPLRPSPNLWAASISHAIISGLAGTTGHQGFNARLFISQPFSFGNTIGENCAYGERRGYDIALQLLIDRGVPSLGHRHNILNPDFSRVGGARFFHRGYTWNAVFDYSSPKWIDFIFYQKPDISQWGLNLEISQISLKPMAGIGASCFFIHNKTTCMMADLNYQKGLLKNQLHAASAYIGYGSATGFLNHFMIGTKFSSYFPDNASNLYIQPTFTFFSIISLLRNGYTYELNDINKSATYRFSYGYNFCIWGIRNSMVAKHNVSISRFISLYTKSEKRKKKHR